MQELGERECADNLVCRRNAVHTAICQPRTGMQSVRTLARKYINCIAFYHTYNLCLFCAGPCFENDRRPMGSDNSAPQLKCNNDSGNFEARQNNDRQQWCVSPMNGMEILGTRRNRSMRLDCNRMGKLV